MPHPDLDMLPLASIARAVDQAFLGSEPGMEAYSAARNALLESRPMTMDEIEVFELQMKRLDQESDELTVDLRWVA